MNWAIGAVLGIAAAMISNDNFMYIDFVARWDPDHISTVQEPRTLGLLFAGLVFMTFARVRRSARRCAP